MPPVPVPLLPEEVKVPPPVERHPSMQPAPARLEERLAAGLPRRRGFRLHRPHRRSQSPTPSGGLWRLRRRGVGSNVPPKDELRGGGVRPALSHFLATHKDVCGLFVIDVILKSQLIPL